MSEPRKLRVFLCHASQDKSVVRDLYRRLKQEGWIDPWLDEEKLLPGQDWDLEIEKAVEQTDVVLVCLSSRSVDKEGYIQKELRFVLNIADEKPEGAIFVVPLRLDDCPAPRRLRMWQYVDYFPKTRRDWAYQRLLESLELRANKLGIPTIKPFREVDSLKDGQELEEAKRTIRVKEIEISAILAQADAMLARERGEKARLEKELEKKKREESEVREKTKERGESKATTYQAPITTQNLKRYGIGALVIVALAGIIFGSNYIFRTVLAPGIGKTKISEKDGMVMVYIPVGEFKMGSNDWGSNEQPLHTVYLDAYWIDQTEVTNAMYANCVAVGACKQPPNTTYYGDANYAQHPVVYVSWNDASAYCAWAGRRLPTEAEWEKAAGWDTTVNEKRAYPWGNDFDCKKGNFDDETQVGSYVVPGGANCDGFPRTSPVGSFPSGASFYNVLDMAGNVWEWVSDWYDAYPDNIVGNPSYGTNYRVLRGGSWFSNADSTRSTFRYWSSPTSAFSYLGFRCALSASE